MYEQLDITKLVIQERIDRAEQARRAASCRRGRRTRHGLSQQLHRFADRLDS
jgi:hypothetical protein